MVYSPQTAAMNSDSRDREVISVKEAYPILVQLVIHAESISWNRFYNFLMANSILVLAWATIFAAQRDRAYSRAVLAAICLFGTTSGIAWAGLAVRGRRFLFDFVTLGQEIEATPPHWSASLNAVKPLSKAANLRDVQAFRWAGSLYLLVFGSLAFTFLYCVMLVASVGLSLAAAPLALIGGAIGAFSWRFRSELRSTATQRLGIKST